MCVSTKKVNESYLQRKFYGFAWNLYHAIIPNVYINQQSNEMDLFGIRANGYTEEIEIKTCHIDFRNDFKKKLQELENKDSPLSFNNRYVWVKKHDSIKNGNHLCNRFSFLVTDTIFDKCEFPDYAGIYIYNTEKDIITKHRQGKMLHKNKVTEKIWREISHKFYFKYWNK